MAIDSPHGESMWTATVLFIYYMGYVKPDVAELYDIPVYAEISDMSLKIC